MQNDSHFYVMTVQKALRPGATADYTQRGTLTPTEGATRSAVFEDIFRGITGRYPELTGASVLFFTLEPNRL